MFLALASTLLWAGYWLLNTRDHRPSVIGLFQNFVYALPILLAWLLLTDGFPDLTAAPVVASLAYVGVFEMGVTFVFWQLAMHYTNNASRIGTLIFLSPFISLFLIHFILGEPLQLRSNTAWVSGDTILNFDRTAFEQKGSCRIKPVAEGVEPAYIPFCIPG